MNEAHLRFLDSYSWIDSIDHLIKKPCTKYRFWKYFQLPILNDMYLEVDFSYKI